MVIKRDEENNQYIIRPITEDMGNLLRSLYLAWESFENSYYGVIHNVVRYKEDLNPQSACVHRHQDLEDQYLE